MTSYCAELARVHKALQALIKIGLDEKEIEQGYDSKGAISMINAPDYGLIDMTTAEGDLVKAIKMSCQNSPTSHLSTDKL